MGFRWIIWWGEAMCAEGMLPRHDLSGGCCTMSVFSQRLYELRKKHGISQAALARELGIALRAYQYYERGQRDPQLAVAIGIADFYQVSLDYLVGRSDVPDLVSGKGAP